MKSTEEVSSERPSDAFFEATGAQKAAGVGAIVAAIIATGMVIAWADKHDTDKNSLLN